MNTYRFDEHNHRIHITMHSGDVYDIAAKENSDNIRLPKLIREIFWAEVQLTDETGNNKTFFVNKNSLAKRTNTTGSLVKYTQKKDKNFDSAMKILNKADRVAKAIEKDYRFAFRRRQKAAELVKIIEEKQEKYTQKAHEGPFIKRKKGRTFLVRIDPKDANKTNFYLKQSEVIGKGGFKTVHPLYDYETGLSNYALSIDDKDVPSDEFETMNKLKDSKYTLNAELLIRDEIASYLMTKRYDGTFSTLLSRTASLPKKLELFSLFLQGVKDMHAKKIVHRDLKNANVLFKDKNGQPKIKIIDFGFSCSFEDAIASKTVKGSLPYLSPEGLKGDIQYPDKLDSWSIGIMLYQLCEGHLPSYFKELEAAPIENFQSIIRNGVEELDFETLADEDDPLRATILGLLNPNPAERLSVDDAYQAVTTYFYDL